MIAVLTMQTTRGATPFFWAVGVEHESVIKLLLRDRVVKPWLHVSNVHWCHCKCGSQ
jgi:hypothetical protein